MPQVGFILFRRRYLTTVEVTCKDKSYGWLLRWITARGARDTQHLSVDTSFIETESGKIQTRYDFNPSVGVHFMKYGGTWIRVERSREQRLTDPWESIQVRKGSYRVHSFILKEEFLIMRNQMIKYTFCQNGDGSK